MARTKIKLQIPEQYRIPEDDVYYESIDDGVEEGDVKYEGADDVSRCKNCLYLHIFLGSH